MLFAGWCWSLDYPFYLCWIHLDYSRRNDMSKILRLLHFKLALVRFARDFSAVGLGIRE